jgi:hypothetical protein
MRLDQYRIAELVASKIVRIHRLVHPVEDRIVGERTQQLIVARPGLVHA